MAKNYTYEEAVAIIAEGKDLEAITDLGRRFPVLVQKTTVVATRAGEDFVELMSFMPEYLTANKVNTNIKKLSIEPEADSGEEEEEENDDVEETKTTKSEAKTKVEETDEDEDEEVDYNKMTSKELYTELSKRGLTKGKRFSKKADMIEALNANDANSGSVEDAEGAETEEAEEAGKYDGKSAVELFKLCKSKGIKAQPKKSAKFYVDLLTKADAAAEDAEDEDADDNWDDDEETPKKKPAAEAKAKKEVVEEDDEDEDDDWDI